MEELVGEWTEDELGRHETPNWWNNAKFGIFIHWGVYSVPAWAPPNVYAEWYDWTMHNPPDESNPTWEHHLQTYGPNVVYDDFIANFTASKFDPSAWLDLFENAGAKYFVFVTKHHDGFALFDTLNTTHRSSVYLGPKRDFLKELMDTAKKEKPDMKRGTYYSLPEWFNPSYAPYGFSQWPGGLARNAFNSTVFEPYTGYLPIEDYVNDLQYEHMKRIVEVYDSDIMWCDIGGPNNTLRFAAEFYNHAQEQGREVTINNRCGAVPDFDTPEYATFGSIQPRAWESSEGMDPFSYGLNSATQPGQYMNGSTIVRTVVDVVSKGGNFLLDVGPNAEGEIIDAMKDNLLDAGEWLAYNGKCIYNTSYWYPTPQDPSNPNLYFLTTPTTFCIISFSAPVNGKVAVGKRIPIMDGDEVVLLQHEGEKSIVWQGVEDGGVVFNVGVEDDGRYAWGFEVRYA
ncbi:glycoside hydrolase family 29 protein [Cyathus striatus]|nr:glycoside hydrolase family 29 protein [Cyathus striatus]